MTISNEETEFISFIIDPLIVHHILSPNKKETKQEGKPERIFPELDIPLPVTEENKDEYLAELDKISAAEQWVENIQLTRIYQAEMNRKYVIILLTSQLKQSKRRNYLTMVYHICISNHC